MNLKTFNQETLPTSSKSKAGMYINTKAGMFHISKAGAEKLGLKDGDLVELHQNEDDKAEWFISKSKKGFSLRNKQKGSDENGLIFNNTVLAKIIFESIECKNQAGRCLFGSEPQKIKGVEYWPVITASLNKAKF